MTETHDLVHEHTHDRDHEYERVVAGSGAAATGTTAPHRHRHRHVLPAPNDPFANYVPGTAFGIGMIHGVGAETPTQVLIFLTAAGAGGKGAGLLVLMCFLVGLLASNCLIALAGTFGFLGAGRNFALYVAVSVVTALFSAVIGIIFLFGASAALPALIGG
jgi:high-affinity nickel-transport protein